MKKSLLMFAFIAAFGLASCSTGGNSSSSPTSSSSSTSSSSPASSSSGQTSSSDPISSSGSEDSSSSSSVEEEKTWTSDDLEIIQGVIGNHDLPYYDFSALGLTYTLGTGTDSYGDDYFYLQVRDFDATKMSDFITFFTGEDTAYSDLTSQYKETFGWPDGYYYLYGTYEDTSEVQVMAAVYGGQNYGSVITSGTGIFQFVVYPIAIAVEEWPGTEISNLIYSLTYEEVTVPEPSDASKANYYLTYTAYDADYNYYAMLDFVGKDVTTSYASDLETAGWKIIEDFYDGYLYYISPSTTIGVLMYAHVSEGLTITTLQFTYNAYLPSFPSETVASALDTIAGSSEHGSLPTPTASVPYYAINDYSSMGLFYVYAMTVDITSSYQSQLEAAGWSKVGYEDGAYIYADSYNAIFVSIYYSGLAGGTTIRIQKASEGYYAGYASTVVSSAITALGGTVSLPTPSFDVDFSYVHDGVESDGTFQIDLKDVDENGSFVDHSKTYMEQLDASSDWTYDSYQDVWYDSNKKLAVAVSYTSLSGVRVLISAYSETYTSWPSEAISSGLTALGITSGSVTSISATAYVLLELENAFQITAYGVSQETYDSYVSSLVTAGYGHSNPPSGEIYWEGNKNFYLNFEYDSTAQTLNIIVNPISSLNYTSSFLSRVFMMIQNSDSEFVFPSYNDISTALGTVSMMTSGSMFMVYMYIFDTSIESSIVSALTSAGYTTYTDPLDGSVMYQLSTTDNTWKVTITTDTENNYTQILLTNV